MLDYIRIACAVPNVKVGDVAENARQICDYIEQADEKNVDVLVLPELSLTGYTCGDLFFQDALHNGVKQGIRTVAESSAKHPKMMVAVGLPFRFGGKLYNCAGIFAGGKLKALVPKTHIPNYNEFSEKRWFSSGADVEECYLTPDEVGVDGGREDWVVFGTKSLFAVGDAKVGVEICEDMWHPHAPSMNLALNGAEVIINLTASDELAGKRSRRRELVKHRSGVCNSVYALCSTGSTESTQSMVFSGHSVICANGAIMAENAKPVDTGYMLVADCDLGKIRADRLKNQYFSEGSIPVLELGVDTLRSDGSLHTVSKLPFVPMDKQERLQRCEEIFAIQVAGLKRRLEILNSKPVLGISGGLDSTLALLVTVEAMRQLGRPMSDIYGVTMPCFGTSQRTYDNAWELMRTLGITAKEINIKAAVTQHFADIGHDMAVHDGTYENSQARERTQILMDYASVVGGLVVGTGDLSELALGWCTYNGDHMSMYGVNASVPKTLIRWIIGAVADKPEYADSKAVLADILDTPISPELLPPDESGKISQQTEDIVGPYALHDFFLYYVVRYGYTPTKIYHIACKAFGTDFPAETVKKWLVNFYRRFFTQQFKRNCMPDGPMVGKVSLSTVTGWRMPSDGAMTLWLKEAEQL